MVPAQKGLMSHLATFIEMNRAEYITLCSYVISAEILHFFDLVYLYVLVCYTCITKCLVYTLCVTQHIILHLGWQIKRRHEHRKYIYFILFYKILLF